MSKEKLYIYMYNIYFKNKACKFECSEKKLIIDKKRKKKRSSILHFASNKIK